MYQNRLCSVETTFKIYLLFGTVFSNLKTKVKTSRRNTTNYFLFPGSGHRLLSVFSGLQQEQNCWQVLANRFQLQFWFLMSMVARVLDVYHPGQDESVFSTAQMLFTRPIHLSLSPGEERKLDQILGLNRSARLNEDIWLWSLWHFHLWDKEQRRKERI